VSVTREPIPDAAGVADYPPLPVPDYLTRFFWDGVADHKLLIQRCRACGTYIHYPRPVCPSCLAMEGLEPAEMSGRGTIYSHTTAVQPFHPYFVSRSPYNIVVVALEEDDAIRVTSNVVDCDDDDIRVGMPVRVTFREVAPGLTLPLFMPA
jgi:uncharacterized OB-fold protein